MRLIDAEALRETLKAVLLLSVFSDEAEEEKQALKHGNKLVRELVDGLPTIDAAPVVHARWKRYFVKAGEEFHDHAYCSACRKASTAWAPDITDAMRYCFHCGAKMDEKEEDDNADA